MIKRPIKKLLCKKCKKNERVTLAFCQKCREEHNKQTRELKRKYRKEKKCCMCGKSSSKRLCFNCLQLQYKYIRESKYTQSKKAKQGIFAGIKQLNEVL